MDSVPRIEPNLDKRSLAEAVHEIYGLDAVALKKTQKTPRREIEAAKRVLADYTERNK